GFIFDLSICAPLSCYDGIVDYWWANTVIARSARERPRTLVLAEAPAVVDRPKYLYLYSYTCPMRGAYRGVLEAGQVRRPRAGPRQTRHFTLMIITRDSGGRPPLTTL